jgi:hypothetical protein
VNDTITSGNAIPPEWASDEERWQGVDAAFTLVAPSHQWLITRTEAADSRLGGLTTAASALLFGVPTFGAALRPSLQASPPLYIALAFILLAAVISLLARVHGGKLLLCDPGKLYEKSLGDSDWKFKKNAIYFAGQHFRENARTVAVKSGAAVLSGWLLLVGALFASIWLTAA